MATTSSKDQICLKLLIDEKKNKVLFAQAGKDFVDVLLSFLTLPLGTIARLVSAESNLTKVSVGSISSLYESVANIDEKLFWTATCKEMLLQPRNSMERYCQDMKLNIDDTEKTRYFICEEWECSRKATGGLLSTFRNQRCKCGKPMNRQIYHRDSSANGRTGEDGFALGTTFIISDDLNVKPDNFQSFFCLPTNLGYTNFDAIKLVPVNVTKKEIMDLLKCSLISKTPLTDVLLLKKQIFENVQSIDESDFDVGGVEANGGDQTMKVKIVLRKSNKTVLFALGEEDFADFILSFLTFPLGGVEHMLNGNTCLGSIDYLCKSMLDLDGNTYLTSPDIKDKLVNSQLAHQFKLRNQILPIDEVPTLNYSCYSSRDSRGKFIAPFLKPVKESFSDVKPTCIRESSAVSRTLRKKRKLQEKK
ncbi:hypothetical protein SESBI_38130 [Sesbania bispinosa]|nr:hypothetical protein SESBI_38130 [Sesbania bispinosa]